MLVESCAASMVHRECEICIWFVLPRDLATMRMARQGQWDAPLRGMVEFDVRGTLGASI